MESRRSEGRARPVVTNRDYQVVRKLVMQYVRQTAAQRDWERTKALLRELAVYERQQKLNPEHAVIWAQRVFADRKRYAGPRRRWLDSPRPAGVVKPAFPRRSSD